MACIKLTGIDVTVLVSELKAEAVASTPVDVSLTVFSKAVIFEELDDTVPFILLTLVCRVLMALALLVILVSSTATKFVPSYLYCFLLSFVSNQISPSCKVELSGLAVGSLS